MESRRQNNDTAPDVYRGMEGGPGHPAGALATDGSQRVDAKGAAAGVRGGYGNPRGTSSSDAEPPMDLAGENPWSDLWFYSNPVMIGQR